ncbi:ATP-binding protein [candidate division KSB1 bacterium]|nr:ATP-binding protein [candidate division KSB1 bacterium]MBL7095450.1 ATP-binding protein [candidate division KSB1 bacterium]
MIRNRYLTKNILQDLSEKMIFIGGARQVGKTTLAKKLVAPDFKEFAYYNWDARSDRKKIMRSEFPGSAELIIFDEIHKYPKWKNLVKGEYDIHKDRYKFLITGSARLNIYRKGGDSLQGRYHYYTLHPFSLAEILNIKNDIKILQELPVSTADHFNDFEILDRFGGFPEMLLKQNERSLRRWHNEKMDRLFREDIRDIEAVRDIANMQLLSDFLPSKVGSLLSINSLREDLEVSHRAATNWLSILEQFYYHFRIYPFHKKNIRSIKKEAKLYMFDWSEVENEAARFENLIASHLLKLTQYLKEYEGYRTDLYYLRNVDKKEVDFFVTVDDKPWFCVEAKLNDTNPSPSFFYFKERLNIPYTYQVVRKQNVDILQKGIRVISADRFLASLI